MIREQLRQSALSQSSLAKSDPKSKMVVAASQASDAPPEELQAVIGEVACNIHGYYVLKSSQDDLFRCYFCSPSMKNCVTPQKV